MWRTSYLGPILAKLSGRERRLLGTLILFSAGCLVNNQPGNPLAMECGIAQHGL
jgi:hypothetical protein